MKVSGITPNYYSNYNRTKANNTPAFKGEFHPVEQIPEEIENKIKEFFLKYMSPGVNINNSARFSVRERYSYYTPYIPKGCIDFWEPGIVLEHVPKNSVDDIKYYITNAKDIEDEVLSMTFNYYKDFVDNYDFKNLGNGADNVGRFKKFAYAPEYLKKQYEYLEKHPDRLPTSYKAKLDLFKNFTGSAEFKRVFNALEKFAK